MALTHNFNLLLHHAGNSNEDRAKPQKIVTARELNLFHINKVARPVM